MSQDTEKYSQPWQGEVVPNATNASKCVAVRHTLSTYIWCASTHYWHFLKMAEADFHLAVLATNRTPSRQDQIYKRITAGCPPLSHYDKPVEQHVSTATGESPSEAKSELELPAEEQQQPDVVCGSEIYLVASSGWRGKQWRRRRRDGESSL